MYLKKLKLNHYRKFYEEQNEIEFVSSKIKPEKKDNQTEEQQETKIDIATDTTLIIGKNNAGKTTIISALEKLIKQPNTFGVNDFNFRYLQNYLVNYDVEKEDNELPFIEFGITIELEENSDDRISNLVPFMLVEDLEDTELDIFIKYEVKDATTFRESMKELKTKVENIDAFDKFLKLLNETDFTLNYYDKNKERLEIDFKLSNLMDIRCIKANHLRKLPVYFK